MAKRKSVTISAKPAHASEISAAGAAPLNGDLLPATGSTTENAAAAGADSSLGLIGRTVYGAVWALSFGCVFGALMVARILPRGHLLASGLCDGAHAAREAAGLLPGSGDKTREAGLRA